MFRIYPTLVEEFMNFQKDLYGITEQDVINKINRVPHATSEAAEKGTSFHELTEWNWQQLVPALHRKQMCYFYDRYRFPSGPVEEIGGIRLGGVHEVYLEKMLETKYGPVLMYGFIDTIKDGISYDVKTTKRYDIGKFLPSLQRSVYPWMSGSRQFQFLVTNFNAVFKEDYFPNGTEEERVRVEVEEFLLFCSHYKGQITDPKFLGKSPKEIKAIEAQKVAKAAKWGIALTWDNLADLYGERTGGKARIKPMDEVFEWAKKEDDLIVHPDEGTIHWRNKQ